MVLSFWLVSRGFPSPFRQHLYYTNLLNCQHLVGGGEPTDPPPTGTAPPANASPTTPTPRKAPTCPPPTATPPNSPGPRGNPPAPPSPPLSLKQPRILRARPSRPPISSSKWV